LAGLHYGSRRGGIPFTSLLDRVSGLQILRRAWRSCSALVSLFSDLKEYKNKVSLIDVFFPGARAHFYAYCGFQEFIYRAVTPELWDMIMGVIFIVLILEATRRSSGWIMPITCILFLIYAIGSLASVSWSHRGYDLERIVRPCT
jgi:TRAP-type uncharacterized transport system fused permease subunit